MDRHNMDRILKPILTIKDRALDIYNLPFVQTTVAQGVRGFTDEVNRDPSQSGVAAHPDDYDLYVIAHYDEVQGVVIPLERPELVVRGKDLIRRGE